MKAEKTDEDRETINELIERSGLPDDFDDLTILINKF